MNIDKTWGVKCLTEPGWFGAKKPKRFTKDEAREQAERLNRSEDNTETWEARKLP